MKLSDYQVPHFFHDVEERLAILAKRDAHARLIMTPTHLTIDLAADLNPYGASRFQRNSLFQTFSWSEKSFTLEQRREGPPAQTSLYLHSYATLRIEAARFQAMPANHRSTSWSRGR